MHFTLKNSFVWEILCNFAAQLNIITRVNHLHVKKEKAIAPARERYDN